MFEMWLLAQVIGVVKAALTVALCAWAAVPAVRAMRKDK